jgi:hypothetical protein
MHIEDIKNLYPQERLDAFAKINSKDLELIMHHCSVELQERDLVEQAKKEVSLEEQYPVDEDDLLGEQTAQERRIWL